MTNFIPDIYTVAEFVIILVISGVCGGLARAIFDLGTDNFFLSIIIGLAGGYLGMYLVNNYALPVIFVLPIGSKLVPVVWILIGALLLTFVASLIESLRTRKKKTRKFQGHKPKVKY